jgi:hypothetical protein
VSSRGQFAYAQARLQARLGSRDDPAELQRAHSARDLPGLLAAVRSTGLRRYAARLAPGMDVHELERHLRNEWTGLVDEVAQWQPTAWQDAVRWLRWLPWLPLLQKLARGGRPPAWARSDPVLGTLVAMEPALRGAALTRSPLRPMQAALAAPNSDLAATVWLGHWRALWPQDRHAARALERIVQDVAVCGSLLRDDSTRDSGEPLRALSQRLLRRFRQNPLAPAAAVAYLGLEGLALLSLRGAVLSRAVLEPVAA